LNPAWIPRVAQIYPWAEWILGSFLIVGYIPRLAAAGAGFLFLSFLVVLTSSGLFLESAGSDCGCFGQSGIHLTIRQVFFVDLASLALSLRLSFAKSYPASLHSFLVKREEDAADKRKV
jgi:hypothetical protein